MGSEKVILPKFEVVEVPNGKPYVLMGAKNTRQ